VLAFLRHLAFETITASQNTIKFLGGLFQAVSYFRHGAEVSAADATNLCNTKYYRCLCGDMIEVFKIVHDFYHLEAAVKRNI